MGYHAPSAEQVYKYLFHLDRPSSGLTDGFCWSVLFVNDNSDWSREFLRLHGAELCFRTADRVRFVFFSHLSDWETERIAQRARSGTFLQGLLARVGWSDGPRRYDYESPPWDQLRPEALHPLRTAEEVSHQLSMECEINSAMPGTQEALLFAQRLGIARFVPCFLVFTEVGKTHVELLPTQGMSTADAYLRVRYWIDSFYEANRRTLDYWRQAEQDVATFCSESQSSVSAVRQWADRRHKSSNALRKVAATLLALDRAPLHESATVLRRLATDHSLPWECRAAVDGLLKRLDEFEARNRKRAEIEATIRHVEGARTREALQGALRELRAGTIEVNRTQLTAAIKQLEPPRPTLPPSAQLVAWWRSEFGRPLSRNRYDYHRKAFASFSESRHGIAAKGRVGQLKRAEFEACSAAASATRFTLAPEEAADKVLEGLASHLQVHRADPAWTTATATYRAHLRDYFAGLQEHAPPWLRSCAEDKDLLVDECVPPTGTAGRASTSSLDNLPRLKMAVRSVEAEQRRDAELAEQKRNESCERVKDATIAELRERAAGLKTSDGDIAAVREAAVSTLAGVRGELATVALTDAVEAPEAPFPGRAADTAEAQRLLALLVRYEAEAAQVSFPFLDDHDLLRVGTPTPLVEATGLHSMPAGGVDGANRLRNLVEEAEQTYVECAIKWPAIRAEVSRLTPVGWLAGLVGRCLGEPRSTSLASELGDRDLLSALRRLGIVAVLDRLDVSELVQLEAASRSSQSWRPKQSAVTKKDLYDAIMANSGLSVGPDREAPGLGPRSSAEARRRLVDKVKRGEFDIFLAHNSVDRVTIVKLGSNLRARGISPWIDVEQVPPGRWFQDVLQSVVRRVSSVAVVIGTSGLGRWQAAELRASISRCVEDGIPVIPVLLPGVKEIPSNLLFLRELNAVAFEHSVDEDVPLQRLAWGITGRKDG